nr:MAG TPA: hypothetical protein [Caudoviricetes sp.]
MSIFSGIIFHPLSFGCVANIFCECYNRAKELIICG